MSYYADKLEILRDVFGDASLRLEEDLVITSAGSYPIVDDVIVTLPTWAMPQTLRTRLGQSTVHPAGATDFAEDIQHTFGEEWKTFSTILVEHEETFRAYFSQIDLEALSSQRLCDLGCGMGRWSHFVAPYCRELILVDFSEAIFVARRNLRDRGNAVFIMADIRRLPFAPDFADMIFSLGVLHHLPTPALDEVVRLRPFARRLLVYLYYALDNRPWFFRAILHCVTPVRRALAGLRRPALRNAVATFVALFVYRPMVGLGHMLRPFGLANLVPLHEGYRGRSLAAIRQDAYDRFFTRIEQRVTRREIESLRRHFSRVEVSPDFPYWHFVCER